MVYVCVCVRVRVYDSLSHLNHYLWREIKEQGPASNVPIIGTNPNQSTLMYIYMRSLLHSIDIYGVFESLCVCVCVCVCVFLPKMNFELSPSQLFICLSETSVHVCCVCYVCYVCVCVCVCVCE